MSDLFGQSIKDVITFLDAPQFNVDIWNMVAQVLELIDKRTGLTFVDPSVMQVMDIAI